MEFDIKRVYTPLNADKLAVGSKCIFADTMGTLKTLVRTLKTLVRCDDGTYGTLKRIRDESCSDRFVSAESGIAFNLAYLVAEPSHLKWTDLKVGDVIEKDAMQHMVIAIDSNEGSRTHIFIANEWLLDKELAGWTKVSYPKDVEKGVSSDR